MINPKTDPVIAYICDGQAECSLEPGCFFREDPWTSTDTVCHHTLDPEHAKNALCDDPENYPERFAQIPEYGEPGKFKYYERLPGEEV